MDVEIEKQKGYLDLLLLLSGLLVLIERLGDTKLFPIYHSFIMR